MRVTRNYALLTLFLTGIAYGSTNEIQENNNIKWLPEVEHFVNTGDVLTISKLIRSAVREVCFLRKPDGHIWDGESGVENTDIGSCTYTLGPIYAISLGDWIICGNYVQNFEEQTECQRFKIAWNTSPISGNVGDTLEMTIRTLYTVEGCYLETPTHERIEFRPVDRSRDFPHFVDKVELRPPTILFGCAVTLSDIEEKDAGIWRLYYEHSGGGFEEIFYNLTVIPNETSEEEESDGINWLTQINHLTKTGDSIDISLSKTQHVEKCTLERPNNGISDKSVEEMASSQYVSCRYLIGPMTADLLGTWTICGEYTDSDVVHKRCRRVNIAWRNRNNPGLAWYTESATVNYTVHFGGHLTPAVRAVSGQISTCHIITPYGEDLTLTDDAGYPTVSLERTASDLCSVNIGPIHENHLANWTLYGKFTSSLQFNEVRRPMNLFLYDPNNPYAQAYNITVLDPVNRVVRLGNTIEAEVAGTGQVDDCELISPSGETFDLRKDTQTSMNVSFVDVESRIACRVSIGPIMKEMLGAWQLNAKFSDRNIFTERQQTFRIIQEDPENPLEDGTRVVDTTMRSIDTTFGSSHAISISLRALFTHDSCHIRTPQGLQYKIMEGFHIPGIDVIRSDSGCAVNVTVGSEDILGEWTLISRQTRSPTNRIESRLVVNLHVEETVETLPQNVVITEGNDLYIRLRNETDIHSTCRLQPPTGSESKYEIDERQATRCGYIVKNVTQSDSGTWEIIYGNKAVYRGSVNVNVNERWQFNETSLGFQWTENKPVQMEFGPDDAVYCRIFDSPGQIVSENFGKCQIDIERATPQHRGIWSFQIASAGSVMSESHYAFVQVREQVSETAAVETSVVANKPAVLLSCSLPSDQEVKSCLFQTPGGYPIHASNGVSENIPYTNISYVGIGSKSSECGISLTRPSIQDVGMWRCAVTTDQGVSYGFLNVTCPWLTANNMVNRTELSLREIMLPTAHVDGSSAIRTCYIETPIRYCYFRAPNGTIYNIRPGISTGGLEYAGAGFEAGECGIRFPSLRAADAGAWSCHVGLVSPSIPEQRASVNIHVTSRMRLMSLVGNGGRWLRITAAVSLDEDLELEYCRFVRGDGSGFTVDNAPSRMSTSFFRASCELRISLVNAIDLRPWTVVVKIKGQAEEISRTITPLPPIETSAFNVAVLWSVTMVVVISLLMLACSLGPKKNREWTYARASALRTSIRNSFRKPPRSIENGDNNTNRP